MSEESKYIGILIAFKLLSAIRSILGSDLDIVPMSMSYVPAEGFRDRFRLDLEVEVEVDEGDKGLVVGLEVEVDESVVSSKLDFDLGVSLVEVRLGVDGFEISVISSKSYN